MKEVCLFIVIQFLSSTDGSGEIEGGLGGNSSPIRQDPEIFRRSRKFRRWDRNCNEEASHLSGGKSFNLNEQTKCSRSICSISLRFYALTFISKTRRKWLGIGWVQYRYFRGVLKCDWERRSKLM